MAGVVPGMILASHARAMTWFIARGRTTIRACRKATWAERFAAFRKSIWGLLLIVIVLGGIYARRIHADRSRRHERGLRLRHRGVRLLAT